MSLKTAVHFAYQIQGLTNKAHAAVKELLDPPDVSNIYSYIVYRYINISLILSF